MSEPILRGPEEDQSGWWISVDGVSYRFATEQEALGFKNIMLVVAQWARSEESESRWEMIRKFLARYGIEPSDPEDTFIERPRLR